MAEIVTKKQLEDASVDAKDLGECVHGNETGIVTPRLGLPYPTLPAAIEKIENIGGYVSAATLAELNTRTPSYNFQLARVEATGDEYRWTPSATPPSWIPTGKNWLNSAKIYADQQDLVIDANAQRYVQIPKEVSKILINKAIDTSTPKFGSISAPQSGTNVGVGTYILATPATTQTILKRFSIVSNIAAGDIELRRYTRVGDTFTMQGVSTILKVLKVGLNEFTSYDFKEITLQAGEYVGVVIKTAGAMVYNGSSSNDVYFSNGSTGTSPIVGSAGKFNIKCAFFETNGVERAQKFIDYIEQASNDSVVNFENILKAYSGNLGLVAEPSAKSGVNNGIAHMCIGSPVAGFGNITTLQVFSATAGTAQVGVYAKNGTTFTRLRFQSVTLAAGLNTIAVNLAISDGNYVGLKTSVVGQIEYETLATGHAGMFISQAGFTDNEFTASTPTPVMTYAYQVRFTLTLKALANDISQKKWIGKTVPFFGDSITWQHLRVFGAGKAEEGQMCYGYQFEISESLGCIVDNKGESGWTMPGIYANRILQYDFSDAYATTITSGANDHKNSVAVGVTQPIGSTFNTATFSGALQASIEHIITSNPNTKIFLITPIRGWYSQATADAITGEMHGVTMLSVRYANAMKEIGALYSLPVIDWYNEVGFNDLNKYEFLGDDPILVPQYLLHPKNKGYRRMGELLLSVLRNF